MAVLKPAASSHRRELPVQDRPAGGQHLVQVPVQEPFACEISDFAGGFGLGMGGAEHLSDQVARRQRTVLGPGKARIAHQRAAEQERPDLVQSLEVLALQPADGQTVDDIEHNAIKLVKGQAGPRGQVQGQVRRGPGRGLLLARARKKMLVNAAQDPCTGLRSDPAALGRAEQTPQLPGLVLHFLGLPQFQPFGQAAGQEKLGFLGSADLRPACAQARAEASAEATLVPRYTKPPLGPVPGLRVKPAEDLQVLNTIHYYY